MSQNTEIAEAGSGALSVGSTVLLDVDGADLNDLMDAVWHHVADRGGEHDWLTEVHRTLHQHADMGPEVVSHGVALVHVQLDHPGRVIQALIRVPRTVDLTDEDGDPIRFLWVLLSRHVNHPGLDRAVEFASLCADRSFLQAACAAKDPDALDALYARALDEDVHFHPNVPPELRPTGRWFGALRRDLRRTASTWVSDWRDGLRMKSVASIVFMYFACLAPSVAFGGLLSVMTDGAIGVVETMLATAITGVLYATFSGQPLNLLGATGPITAFLGILYGLCAWLDVPYLPTMAWVGLWTALYLWILIAWDGASLIRFFTRFTDETFAALIALIYLWEALRDIGRLFTGPPRPLGMALLSLLLALGTYQIAAGLSSFRRSPYLRGAIREFLADFGPTIAIVLMTAVALFSPDVGLETLAVPESFGTTSGRGWLVNPFEAPRWVWIGASVPAIMGAILVYLDHNITARLVNSPEHPLKKGGGYHQDLGLVALLVAGFSLVGLPWAVAATVRSLNHVHSVAKTGGPAGHERVVAVMEQRVTHLGIHVLIGASLLLLPLLKLIPTAVLFGLFLYMGIASTRGNQFFERIRLWFLDPSHYPVTHYVRAVPMKVIHRYTAIQALCLAALWAVKISPLGIVFPMFIALLVPIRMSLERMFKKEHLALLDAVEGPDEERERDIGG